MKTKGKGKGEAGRKEYTLWHYDKHDNCWSPVEIWVPSLKIIRFSKAFLNLGYGRTNQSLQISYNFDGNPLMFLEISFAFWGIDIYTPQRWLHSLFLLKILKWTSPLSSTLVISLELCVHHGTKISCVAHKHSLEI